MISRLRDPLTISGSKNYRRVMPGFLVACVLAAIAAPAHAQYYNSSPYMAMGAVSMVPMLGVTLVRTALMPLGALTRKNNNNSNKQVKGQVAQQQQQQQQMQQQPTYPPMNGQPNYGQTAYQPIPQAQAVQQGYPGQNNPYAAGYSTGAMPGMSYTPQNVQPGAAAGQIPGMQNQQAYNTANQVPAGAYGPSASGQ